MSANVARRHHVAPDAAPPGADTVVPRSIGRVLDLLEAVIERGGCNLTTAAGDATLTPTTARRHLRALEYRGYLCRDASGDFSAGPQLLRLAAQVNDGDPLGRLVAAARPHLAELAARTGESTYLAIADGDVATYVATAGSSRAIRHVRWVGQSVPLHGTAVGDALTSGTPTTVIRSGAVEPDITAVARAIPGHGAMRAAISVIGPRHRLDTEHIAEIDAALVEHADALACELARPAIDARSTS